MADKSQILIVDDDEDILSACRLLLKKRFGKVVTSNTPEVIPELMAQTEFDAIGYRQCFKIGYD